MGDIVVSVFYDMGKVWQYQDPSNMSLTSPNNFGLAGWGLGVDFITAGKWTVKAGWAQAINGNPGANATTGNNSDGRDNPSRYWLLGNFSF